MSNSDHPQQAVGGDYRTTWHGGAPRADAHAPAASPQPYAAALKRIEEGLSLLVARLEEPETPPRGATFASASTIEAPAASNPARKAQTVHQPAHQAAPRTRSRRSRRDSGAGEDADLPGPSLEEAWDQDAADALAELYASGAAGLSDPLGGDEDLQARMADVASPRQAQPAADGAGAGSVRTWVEGRLDEIARKVDRTFHQGHSSDPVAALEQRFAAFERRLEKAFGEIATRADLEGLKLVEGHVVELLDQLRDVRAGLDRVVSIETRLAELKSVLSDDQVARLVGAIMPTEQELSRIAEAAAAKALQRSEAPPQAGDTPAAARLDELRTLLSDFADERRRNELEMADALDTMQQAMEHIHERIDSIVASRADAAEGRAALTSPPALAQGLRQDIRMPDMIASELTKSARATTAPASTTAASPGIGATPRESGDEHETLTADDDGMAFGAMLRPAGAKRASEGARSAAPVGTAAAARVRGMFSFAAARVPPPGALLMVSLLAFMLAGYWLVSGSRLLPAGDSMIRVAGKQPTALEQDIAGVPLRSSSPDSVADATAGADQRSVSSNAADQTAARSVASSPAVQGIAVDQSDVALSPDELMRVRQKQRMATLSSRLGQQAAQTYSDPAAVPADVVTGATGAAHADGEGGQATLLEMPPLTIGPNSLRLAAARGDASAQFEVAVRFAKGKGVDQDFKQAGVWYQRAAAQGLAAAQYRLATLYERGLGVQRDTAQAKVWYLRAADQGNVKAMHNLAVLCAGRDAAALDYQNAAKWFREAAERGLADSQYNLGVLHENGLGVPKNLAAAYKWYALAAMSGDKEALHRRDVLRTKLDSTVLKSIEQQIAEWRPRPIDQLANDAWAAGEAWKSRIPGASG
ncbi:MAG: hypothetical protein ACM31O_18165 [Bacteroidota bacterium]